MDTEVSTVDVLTPRGPAAELEQLGDQIAELSAHLDAATARLLDMIREFDARGGWNTGFRSCAEWLSWRVNLDIGTARQKVRVARALPELPRLAQALACGELSYAKVRALTRVATPETEERLLAMGRACTAEQVERIVRGWRRMDRKAEAREAARQHASRALHVYQDEDGTVTVRGRLAPEVGALLVKALAAARESLYQQARSQRADVASADVSAEPPTMAQQHLQRMERQHEADLTRGAGWVELPWALARKYPNAGREWLWHWVFPATRYYFDRATGQRRRHHLHETVVQRAVIEAVRRTRLAKRGHNDVSTTMIYTHVLNRGPTGVTSLADRVLDP